MESDGEVLRQSKVDVEEKWRAMDEEGFMSGSRRKKLCRAADISTVCFSRHGLVLIIPSQRAGNL